MTNPFSRTALFVLPGAAALSLIVAIGLTLMGDPSRTPVSAGADAYSRSAIGHQALIQLLRKVGIPVEISRTHSAERAKHGLLIVAEPRGDQNRLETKLDSLVRTAAHTLLVLPKWYGLTKPGSPWIDRAALIPAEDVIRTLQYVVDDGDIVRTRAGAWQTNMGLPAPSLSSAQTMTGDVDPIAYAGTQVLVGRRQRVLGDLWVLTDPDVLNNAGLRSGDNAQFVVALIDQLRDGGPVVFDETSHGYQQSTSLLGLLFRFPLVLATLQVALCIVLVIWAALVRFGPRRAAPPPIAPGKAFLIRNTATLLQFGGHHADALRRYLTATIQHVRHALNAPHGLSHAALLDWLERIRLVRAGTINLHDLERSVHGEKLSPQRVLELAAQVHRWRSEMMHESRNRS